MYVRVCMVITYSRVWINWVRLPILFVVSCNRGEKKMGFSLSPLAPGNLVLRGRFGRLVPRQPPLILRTQAESCAYSREFSPLSATASIYFMPPTAIGSSVPTFIRLRNCVPMAFTAESPPAQGK